MKLRTVTELKAFHYQIILFEIQSAKNMLETLPLV